LVDCYKQVDTAYFFTTAVIDAQTGKDVSAELVFLFTEAITDPEKMLSLFNNPAYAAQDWVHLCTWDMLVRGQRSYTQIGCDAAPDPLPCF
jgi:hypothetical protein